MNKPKINFIKKISLQSIKCMHSAYIFPFFCACQTVTVAVVFSVVSAHCLIQTQLMIKYWQCIIHSFLAMCRQNVNFISRSLDFSNLLSRWTEQTCFSQSIFWSFSDKVPDAEPRRPLAGRVADRRCSVLRPRPDLSEVDASLANSRRNRPCENGARKRDGGGAAVGQLTYVSAAGRRFGKIEDIISTDR